MLLVYLISLFIFIGIVMMGIQNTRLEVLKKIVDRPYLAPNKFLYLIGIIINNAHGIIFLFIVFYMILYRNTKAIHEAFENANDGTGFTASIIGIVSMFTVYPILHFYIPHLLTDWISNIPKYLLRGKSIPLFSWLFTIGRGGSADWATIIQLEKRQTKFIHSGNRYIDYPVFGKTMALDDWNTRLVGMGFEDHLITIGLPGSGKSTTVLYPNLALLKTSMYVFDPKGELAEKTFAHRCSERKTQGIDKGETKWFVGQSCFLYDPLEETNGQFPYDYFNPLHYVDLESPNANQYIRTITGALFPDPQDGSSNSKYFITSARDFMSGLIVYVMNTYGEKHHNLPFIVDLLLQKYPDTDDDPDLTFIQNLAIKMQNDDAKSDMARSAGNTLLNKSENELSGFLETFSQGIRWITDDKMRKSLSQLKDEYAEKPHSFTSMPHQAEEKTVYFVMSQNNLKVYYPWVRLFISLTLRKEREVRNKHSKELLYIIDEFAQLGGKFDDIQKDLPFLRGEKIRMWLLFQDLNQVKDVFGKHFNSQLNTAVVQVIGVNDNITSKYVSERLGQYRYKDNSGNNNYKKISPLLSPQEVENMFSKTSMTQIVFFTDGKPARLLRLTYKPLKNRDTGEYIGMSYTDLGYQLKNMFYDH